MQLGKVYSYVVDHDNGYGPNPYFDLCTLCRCKYRKRQEVKRRNIVELAEVGDWVIGTGGASKESAGHGRLVYAMRVDEKPNRWKYFTDGRFEKKKPVKTGTYEQTRGDNELPIDDFEKHKQFALVSRHFYYFGENHINIREFNLEKKGPWFRYVDPADFCRFVESLERTHKPGKHGEPCYREQK
jgi:hypothetical protein